MSNLTEPQQSILKILQESTNPLGPSDIGKKLNQERNKIHYHLTKLKDEGLITCSDHGKYSIDKDEMETLEQLGTTILKLLSVKEYYPRELKEKLKLDESKIISAVYLLELQGSIKEGRISLKKRGGIPRNGPTVHVTDYCRNSTYTPTYLGYSKIDMCPICKKNFSSHDKMITVHFRHDSLIDPEPWKLTQIHSKCLSKSKAYENVYGKYESSMFCHHCGLPLTPKMLPEYSISYKLLEDYFFSFELKSINLLKELIESWHVSLKVPFLKEKRAVTPQNSTIRTVYNKLDLEMPEWLDKRIKEDKNDSEIAPYGEICNEILKDLMFTFDADLSKLKNTENFQKLLIKYRVSHPEDYNVDSRIREVWAAAQAIKKAYDETILNSYEKLIGPEARLYSHIDWAFNPEDYDFDKEVLYSRYKEMPSILAHTFAVKCGTQYYHPYCAGKIGLNDSHCTDKNSNGGESVE